MERVARIFTNIRTTFGGANAPKPQMPVVEAKRKNHFWHQIQLADNIENVVNGSIAKDASSIVFPEKLKGDFQGLASYLYDQVKDGYVSRDLKGERHHMPPVAVNDYARYVHLEDMREILTEIDPSLSREIREAGQNLYNTIEKIIESGGRKDRLRLDIEGPEYTAIFMSNDGDSGSGLWHTDSTAGIRQIGCRVAGPNTEIAHKNSVLSIRKRGDYTSEVQDNPVTTDYGLGTVWAHRAGRKTRKEKKLEVEDGATHRRGEPTGEAGLVVITSAPIGSPV